jgi:hypothetical protein
VVLRVHPCRLSDGARIWAQQKEELQQSFSRSLREVQDSHAKELAQIRSDHWEALERAKCSAQTEVAQLERLGHSPLEGTGEGYQVCVGREAFSRLHGFWAARGTHPILTPAQHFWL